MRPPPPFVRGLAGACLVGLGSLVTTVVPESSWMAAAPLRDSLPGRMAGLAVVVAGLGLMVWAWLAIGREVLAAPARWRDRLLPYAAAWSVPLLFGPPLFSRDAWSYAAQGALVAEGYNPYEYGPGMLRARWSRRSTRCGDGPRRRTGRCHWRTAGWRRTSRWTPTC